MKKFLSIILASLMIVTTLPFAMAASELTDETTSVTLKDIDADGFYEISTAEQLKAFRNLVNAGNISINAELLDDITLNENVLTESYELNGNSSDFETWTPIGNETIFYNGIFDGKNHTISGLYYNGNGAYAGLFGYVNEGSISNLNIIDSYFDIDSTENTLRVGALTGFSYRTVSFNNCYVEARFKVVNTKQRASIYLGGISGLNYSGATNCFTNVGFDITVNSISSYVPDVGGIFGSVLGYPEINNCHTNYEFLNKGNTINATNSSTSVATEKFEDGTICSLVGFHPTKDSVCVVCPYSCPHTSFTNGICDNCGYACVHSFTNGFCSVSGCYEEPEFKDDNYQIENGGNLFWYANYINTVDRTANAVLTADIDLEGRPWTPIGSTGENSNNFRGIFDGQNHTIEGLYVEGGRAGLGFFGEVRTGTVKNFTIYGEVVVNTEVDYIGGVIGSVCGVNGENDLERNGAIIQNITSYVNITAKAHGIGKIGGLVGYANHESLIENCSWYGTFDAGIYRVDNGAGGFVGRIQENSSKVTIRNCGAYGTIKTNYAKNSYNNTATIYIGGFLSFSNTNAKTTLENCLFAGKFERGENLTDEAFLGAFGTLRSVNSITNCYYLGDDGLEAVHSDSNLKPGSDNVEITKVTAEQLKSGEIAYKLQGEQTEHFWGQNIGTDNYPVLGGEKVYYGYTFCTDEVMVYSNDSSVSATNPAHAWGEGVLTRPTKTQEGYFTYTCTACGEATKTEEVERAANYDEYEKALNDLRAYLDSDMLTDENKSYISEWLAMYDSDEAYSFIAGEEATVQEYIDATAQYVIDIENAIQDCLAGNHSGSGDYCEICGAYIHICDFTGEWKTDADKHWKECECGLLSEEGTHTGGTATCTEKAVCETCGTSYGEVAADAHDWSNKDGICANGCGTECAHENQTGAFCKVCGTILHICDFSDAKILTSDADGFLYIDDEKLEGNEGIIELPSGKYVLGGNIQNKGCSVVINSGENVVINLNGYEWLFEDTHSIRLNGEFSLYDLSENKTGKIVAATNGGTVSVLQKTAVFNLYGGTLESTGEYAVYVIFGSANLYSGALKSAKYALYFAVIPSSDAEINLGDTVLEGGDGYSPVSVSCTTYFAGQPAIDISDYTGDSLTVDFTVAAAGAYRIFKGFKNAEEAEKYQININFLRDGMFCKKIEYDESTGEKYVYIEDNTFTQQPSAENNYTVNFTNPDASLQWCEVKEEVIAEYTLTSADNKTVLFEHNFEESDVLKISTDSDIRRVLLYVDGSLVRFDETKKTETIIFNADKTVEVSVDMVWASNPVELKFSVAKGTALEGETGETLQKIECGKSYWCKVTVGTELYLSDCVEGHIATQVDAKAPTCYEIGWDAYAYCTECDYTSYEEIPATNHKDTLVQVEAQAPTCTEIGWDAYEYCTACDYTTYEEKEALDHDIIIDEAVAPKCEETGLTAGQHCSRCDAMTIIQEVVPATNHKDTLVKVEAQEKTCTQAGYEAYEYCTACDYTTYVEIPASHSIVTVEKKDATCTEAGYEAYEYCTDCDYTTYKEIPASHSIVAVEKKDATCTEAGYEAYEYCTACDYTTYKEIPVAGHTEETVKGYAATCTKAGLTDGVKCAVCDAVITAQQTIDQLTHKDDDGDFLCDYGCGYEFEKPAEPDQPDTPDTPDEPSEGDCDHLCHKDGFMGFIWKIVRFFIKLFKINPVCECGAAHW